MRCLDSITNSVDMNLCKLWERVKGRWGVLQSVGWQRVGHGLAMKQQQQIVHEGECEGKIILTSGISKSTL